MRWASGLLLGLALAGCSREHEPPPAPVEDGRAISIAGLLAPAWPHETTHYFCTNGATFQVAYLNIEDDLSYAALYFRDRLSLMRPWPAASGVRYVSIDEQVGLRWHIKGEEGRLAFLAADDMAAEVELGSGCRALARSP